MDSKKYIVIKHSILKEISDAEIKEALSVEGSQIIETFVVQPVLITMEEILEMNFNEAAIFQRNMIENTIIPFIRKNADCKIAYFGAAPIPLALHLGYCLGNWYDYEVYNFHQKNKTWRWENSDEIPPQIIKKFPQDNFRGTGDVVFKVKSSYEIQDQDIYEVVKDSVKEVEVSNPILDVTSIKSMMQLNEMSNTFSEGLAAIANSIPNADKIHLFATVPVGLAFLMGTKISPTVSKKINAYQYFIDRTPRYDSVITLQETSQENHPLSIEEVKLAGTIRERFSEELESKMKGYVNSKLDEIERIGGKTNWYDLVLKKSSYDNFKISTWANLPNITQVDLQNSKVDITTDQVEDGFYVTETFEWKIDNRFILGLYKRLDNDLEKTLCALRMFMLHEALHFRQRLNSFTANNIGRFPRILEEADYQADVWTIIHEYTMQRSADGTLDFKEYFINLITIAIKTMWSFDDLDVNTDEMQVRRINRYLIWYWNLISIGSRDCKTIENVVSFLSLKPVLEIKGLILKTDAQRVLAKLNYYKAEEIEIGIFINNTIERRGNAGGLDVSLLLKGFQERNGELIEKQLKTFFELIRRVNTA